jgi:hypothetical protein
MITGCRKGNDVLLNFTTPKAGDKVAVIETSMGDIKVMFFAGAAPKAVENFTTHAAKGYYDNMIFHRVISGFMIQSGDPQGTGYGGESIWGEPFKNEISENARNFRGALAMANSGTRPRTAASSISFRPARDGSATPRCRARRPTVGHGDVRRSEDQVQAGRRSSVA